MTLAFTKLINFKGLFVVKRICVLIIERHKFNLKYLKQHYCIGKKKIINKKSFCVLVIRNL